MNTEYYINKAQEYLDRNELELAELTLLKGIIKNPDSVPLRVGLSNIYYDTFRYNECLYELERIQKLESNLNGLQKSFDLVKSKITMNPIC